MRYRRPYAARHTSVSWNLMIGRNALLVAKEHEHRPLTMLTVYAAWTEGAPESDIRAIRRARNPNGRRGIRHSDGTVTSPSASNAVESVKAESQPSDHELRTTSLNQIPSPMVGSPWNLALVRHQRRLRVAQVFQMTGEIMAERTGAEKPD
jgi:hypothetical protein